MPFYEYHCKACQHHFEVLQKITDQTLCDCPECHQPKLEKWVSSPAFQLKGEGWYVTDFKGKKLDEKKSEDKAPETKAPEVKVTSEVEASSKAKEPISKSEKS